MHSGARQDWTSGVQSKPSIGGVYATLPPAHLRFVAHAVAIADEQLVHGTISGCCAAIVEFRPGYIRSSGTVVSAPLYGTPSKVTSVLKVKREPPPADSVGEDATGS
jgi:hypothetical protein